MMAARRTGRGSARERGDILLVAAAFMLALLVLVMILLDQVQVNSARMMIDTAVQAAAVDGVRADPLISTLLPPCGPGGPCPAGTRRLVVTDSAELRARVRATLVRDLASVAYLMSDTTPQAVAAAAEIAVVSPGDAVRCSPSPFPGPTGCYHDPFVAVRVVVPLHLLGGALTFKYQSVAVGAVTDNALGQLGATPMPTPRPGVVPTWVVPPPTCDPTIC